MQGGELHLMLSLNVETTSSPLPTTGLCALSPLLFVVLFVVVGDHL